MDSMTFSLTAAARSEGFRTFRQLFPSPSSRCTGGLVEQILMTDVQQCAVYICVWPVAGWNATVWLVGVDKIPFLLACAINCWLWFAFHALLPLSVISLNCSALNVKTFPANVENMVSS